MNLRYIVELEEHERNMLEELTRAGKPSARKVKRALILLMADGHCHSDEEVAVALSTSVSTVARTRKRFVEQGLDSALSDAKSPGAARKLTTAQEASLVALACSAPPPGRNHWTLRMLADELVILCEDLDSISHETVRKRLAEKKLKPWLRKMWCIRKIDADFIARMEDILDLYAEPADPRFPVISFDEGLKQLVGELKAPLPVLPGQPAKQDYHYKRNGTAKLLVFVDVHQPRREVIVSSTRTSQDYALAMKKLVDEFYPEAVKIRVVQDNLNTHGPASLYKTFPAHEARRILRRLEFHYTPIHASWLNMVEIEIGVMTRQCLDRRIPDIDTLRAEVQAWVDRRNREGAKINWIFDVHKAREKMARHYPLPTLNQSMSA